MNRLLETTAEPAGFGAQIAAIKDQLQRLETQAIEQTPCPGRALFPREWIDRVCGLVATEWGISVADLIGSTRQPQFTRPRFVWAWLVREIGRYNNEQVALHCGYGDRSAVLYACRRVEAWRAKYPDFRTVTDLLLDIGRSIRSPTAAVETTAEPGQ